MIDDFTVYLERWQYIRLCGHEAGGWSLCQHKPQPITWELTQELWARNIERARNPPPPEPLVVSYGEFQRYIRDGVIDEDGRILPYRYVARRDVDDENT